MLTRTVDRILIDHFKISKTALLIEGARQIGKSYIIRKKCKEYFKNYIEIKFDSDKRNNKTYQGVRSPEEFYIKSI